MSDPQQGTLPQELVAAIKKEAVGHVAKWALAGGAALVVLAATGWWLVLGPWLSQQLGGVPKNAIMAFHAETNETNGCPSGWAEFNEAVGRTIIGKGQPLLPGKKFESDSYGHRLPYLDWPHGGEFLAADLMGEVPSGPDFQKVNIVPWIALRFCKKR